MSKELYILQVVKDTYGQVANFTTLENVRLDVQNQLGNGYHVISLPDGFKLEYHGKFYTDDNLDLAIDNDLDNQIALSPIKDVQIEQPENPKDALFKFHRTVTLRG